MAGDTYNTLKEMTDYLQEQNPDLKKYDEMEMIDANPPEPQKRWIKLYPDTVAVCTLGPKGDGTDNIMEVYKGCHVESSYAYTVIRKSETGELAMSYDTDEIVMITK